MGHFYLMQKSTVVTSFISSYRKRGIVGEVWLNYRSNFQLLVKIVECIKSEKGKLLL